LLPDGTVLWLNGNMQGAQGFELATNPAYDALLYDPSQTLGNRWTQLSSTTIARLYHSVAVLMPDGTVLIAGSNPHEMPILDAEPGKPYPTEFRVERYTPPYLTGDNAKLRPTDVIISNANPSPNDTFGMSLTVPTTCKTLKLSLIHGGFITHAVHMGQRLVHLDYTGWNAGQAQQNITVTMPPNNNITPPGPYFLYAVVCTSLSLG
jgi:hypothetical protein